VILNKENVKSLISDVFPNSNIKTIRSLNCEASDNFIVDLYTDTDKIIFIKHLKGKDNMDYIHETNLTFLKEKKEKMISAPLIYHVDHEKRIFVMDYIDGLNLHQLFMSLNRTKQNDLKQAIDLSAKALAEFHKIFKKDKYDDKISNFNKMVRKKDVEFINERIRRCNLNFKTQLFFDFKFGNVLFDPLASKLYLIDFPDKDHIFTPHYDIAEFRKEIYIFSQHPKFRLLNKWNNPSIINDRFFSTYYNYIGILPNEDDESIIKYFSNNMIINALKFYSTHKLRNFNIIKYFFIKKAYRMNALLCLNVLASETFQDHIP
jgi:hypothetical protein